MNPLKSDVVPWSEPGELLAWLVLIVAATFLIHNGLREYKKVTH